MSDSTRIRKLPPPVDLGFDEQLWPVNVALLVFAGMVAGLIVVHSDFETTDALHNGYIRLATLAITLGALLIGISLGGKHARRMQLGVMISLIAHSGALITVEVAPRFLGHGNSDGVAKTKPPVVLRDLTVLVPTPPREQPTSNGTAAPASEIERPLAVQSKPIDAIPDQPLVKVKPQADSAPAREAPAPALAMAEVVAPDRVKTQ